MARYCKYSNEIYRGSNAGSKYDVEGFCVALSAAPKPLHNLIGKTLLFEETEEALEYVWQGKQMGKIVLRL